MQPRSTTPTTVGKLGPNQVFVFGTNADGFHGAGAAGFAFRGDASNTWRTDRSFLVAMNAPVGSPHRLGRWAVFGVSRGLQQGLQGQSYGIETIRRPGHKRSTPLSEILEQLLEMCQMARLRQDLEFLVAPLGCGLAGYTESEIKALFTQIRDTDGIPDNVVLPAVFECR